MSGSRFLLCFPVIVALIFTLGCQKKQSPKLLQLPLPKAVAAAPPQPLPQPDIDFKPTAPSQTIGSAETSLPPPPPEKPEPKRVRRTAPAVSPVKAEDELSENPTEMPQLGEVLSEQQQREYLQATETSLDHAKRIAAAAQRRPLDSRQSDVLGQVQGFIRQAEAAHKKDLPLARNLAQRAEVLAKDLLNSLK